MLPVHPFHLEKYGPGLCPCNLGARALQEAKKAHAAIDTGSYKQFLLETTKRCTAYRSFLDLYESTKVRLHVGCGCNKSRTEVDEAR